MGKELFFSTLLIFVFFSSCTPKSPDEQQNDSIVSIADSSEELCDDPSFIEEQNQRAELKSILNSVINLSEMKNEIGFLSMGWSISTDYLPVPEEGLKQYNYGAVGNLIKKPRIEIIPAANELRENPFKFISIITYKPWTSQEEKYYSTNNETIIGFETKVNYIHLNNLNFVGAEENEISELLGMPDLIQDHCYAYKEDQKVLVLHLENDIVDWVKFYHLNEDTFLNPVYPPSLFEWTAK